MYMMELDLLLQIPPQTSLFPGAFGTATYSELSIVTEMDPNLELN